MCIDRCQGVTTAQDIVKQQNIKPTLMSFHIDKLVQMRYVVREEIEGNRRSIKLVCTDKAKPVIKKGAEIYKLYGNEKDENGNFLADKYIVNYVDVYGFVYSMLTNIINIITEVLIAFSAASLIVFSIMIAIITYASVIERIKEIGIIRCIGGRKKDVSRVFIAEACIIGAVSAIIALVVTLLLNGIINVIFGKAVGITTIASLNFRTAFAMIVLAMGLNLIDSLIPARIASKKRPSCCIEN